MSARDALGNRIGDPDECPQPETCRMTKGPTHRHSMIEALLLGKPISGGTAITVPVIFPEAAVTQKHCPTCRCQPV